jgi:hypothetical protein
MNFRLVWIGSDDNPPERWPLAEKNITPVRSLKSGVMYERQATGIVRREQLANGNIKLIPVTNFSARIVRDIILDDDAEQRREFGLEAEVGGQKVACVVPAAEFSRTSWVLRLLGPKAIIYPGQQQHARAAIQCLSGSIQQERIFSHLGWRKHDGHWVYLHAGGAVGAQGHRGDLRVELPAALQHYQVHGPADAQEQGRAVRASLRCVSVAPDWISFPLLAAVYRAALGKVDFSLFLTGQSGVFKTALAALCQQHFGAAMDDRGLPTNFASTGNALQWLAFYAKDALLVVDDFAPTGRHSDSELQNIAERLFRATGNQQGRSRLSGNGRLNEPKPPRALVLATGEQVPLGQSIRARLLILDVRPGEVDRPTLSECQRAGQEGRLATSVAAFLGWIAANYEEVQRHLQTRVLEIRSQHQVRAVHARLPSALAELQTGWEIFLRFAFETGAIGKREKVELEARSQRALAQLRALQAKYQEASDPASRFVALLRAALACGGAHVADRRGSAPQEAELWGWQLKPTDRGWAPLGTRIGWVAESDLFLEPTASYRVAQALAGAERLPVSEQSLRRSLRERRLLASIDAGRQMVLVRRTLEGSPRQVLHMRARDLLVANLQTSGAMLSKPAGRQRSLLKEHSA